MLLSLFSGSVVEGAGRPVADLHPILVVFGSARVDLTGALFEEGPNQLSILSLFGSAEVRVPEDVGVFTEGLAAFGGRDVFGQRDGGLLAVGDFETSNYASAARRLNVTAVTAFGGITLKRAPATVASPPAPAMV